MKIVVTGGAGFIGSHLVAHCVAQGHEVVVIDNLRSGRLANLAGLPITFHHADIREYVHLSGLFTDVDWVFHLAGLADGIASVERPLEYYQVNVDGTFNVLEQARLAGVKRFVYAASSSCYGMPKEIPTCEEAPIQLDYPYALTKYLGEELVVHWGKVYRLPVVSLRLFNVFGPRSRTTGAYGAVLGVFLAQKLHGKPLTVVGTGEQTRDFVYVTDVAKAFYAAASSSVTGEVFNVGSGQEHSIRELAQCIGGEVLHIPERPGEVPRSCAEIKKIRACLGWSPEVTFEEGIARMLAGINDYKEAPVWEPKAIAQATHSWFKYFTGAAK